MSIWAIVPLKPLKRAKSRLSSVLDNDQRATLSQQIFERTLVTLKEVQGIGGILVVSRDTEALSLARRYDVQTVQESGAPELNDALTRATEVVRAWNAQGVLIVASDIPLMQTSDIENMLEMATDPPAVVIAPDRRQEGTNALLVRPPGFIPYRFGASSFRKHREEAEAAGAVVRVYQSATLGLDLDVPDDLDLYREALVQRKQNEPAWLGSL